MVKIKNIDKLAHLGFHFGFTFLWFLYFICQKKSTNYFKIAILLFALSVAYGILIEWAQDYFTVTRKADIFDVISNVIGAFLGVFTVYYLKLRIKNSN